MKKTVKKEDIEDVESPVLSTEFIKDMKPAKEMLPQIPKRVRGPQKKPLKKQVTLRIDPDVVDFFQSQGKGWQNKINDVLRKHVGDKRA